MEKTIIKISLFSLACLLLASFLIAGQAQAYSFEADGGLETMAKKTGHKKIDLVEGNPLVALIMPLVGIGYLMLSMYAGYLWMTAQGNEQQVTKARNIIIAATLGLAIIMASYAISIYVISTFSDDFVQ